MSIDASKDCTQSSLLHRGASRRRSRSGTETENNMACGTESLCSQPRHETDIMELVTAVESAELKLVRLPVISLSVARGR